MFKDWLPMPPTMGPPLPRFFSLLWPWIRTETPETPEVPASGVSISIMSDTLNFPVGTPASIPVKVENHSDHEIRMKFSYLAKTATRSNTGIAPVEFTLIPGSASNVDMPFPAFQSPAQGNYTVYARDLSGNILASDIKAFSIY